jgi:hypothetical protein
MMNRNKSDAISRKTSPSIDEITPSEGIHEIITADGRIFRFVVGKGESPSREQKQLLVDNAELNIATVPPDQRAKLREHIKRMKEELKNH